MSTSPLCSAQSWTQEVWPHQYWVKRNYQLPWPAGSALPSAAWDTTHLLLQGHSAALTSTCFPPSPAAAFIPTCFAALWPPSTRCCLVFLSPGTGLCLQRSLWTEAQPSGELATPPTQPLSCVLLFTNTQIFCLTLKILLTDKENKVGYYFHSIIALELRLAVGKSGNCNEFC